MLRIWAIVMVACLPVAASAQAPIAGEPQPAGAALKEDGEHQRLLARAEQYFAEGRLDLAVVLWQKVLNDAGDALTIKKTIEPGGIASSRLVIYGPLAESVERTIVESPPAALAAYRAAADAEARALLAAAPLDQEQSALEEVARRYFLSTVGDDAAYKLACLSLDRHDFVGAFRRLSKVIERHPDPSPPRAELLSRLAVAAAHVQDRPTAEWALAQLREADNPPATPDVVALVAADVKGAGATATGEQNRTRDWPMRFGNASRTGYMPALPTTATGGTLTEGWMQDFPVAGGSASAVGELTFGSIGRSRAPGQESTTAARNQLIAGWRAGGWRPSGQLLFEGGRVYFKTSDRLVCVRTDATGAQPVWESAWRNRYELDALTQQRAYADSPAGSTRRAGGVRPSSPFEVLLFGDRVHQSLSLVEGGVFSIEGKRETAVIDAPQRNRMFPAGTSPRRWRRNWLTAYQATGGKAQWTRTAGEDDPSGAAEVGFLAAPTPCGDQLIVPVTDGGAVWLYGLARSSGATIWRTYLCDDPPGGAAPWAEPVVAVESRDVYVSTGCGLVFAVDGGSGALNWAVRYPRSGQNPQTEPIVTDDGTDPRSLVGGWDDDVAIVDGRLVVVMASDANSILALDRRTGERVWETPRTPPLGKEASYCLGVHGQSLYVAGKNVVRSYDLPTGRLMEEHEIEDSFGRGCLTEDAVYLPIGTSIVKLDLQLQETLARAEMALAVDEPAGNLNSDGERLWVVGAGRVYSLTPLDERLKLLGEQIAAGSADAQFERMRLYFKTGQTELALADLRSAYERLQTERTAEEAAGRLLVAIAEEELPERQPREALSLLVELFVNATPPPRLSSDGAEQLADVLANCISGLGNRKPPGSIEGLLAAAPLFTAEHLQTAATFAVDGLAVQDDAAALLAALESDVVLAQLVSIRAAVRFDPEAAKPRLGNLLKGGDDRVRLAAARALANLGERENILEALAALLDSASVPVRTRSQQTLQALSGQRIAFAPEGSAEDRAATRKAWQAWIEENGATAKLSLPLVDRAVRLGRTLVVTPSAIVEFDANHQERWRTRPVGAAWGCQGLPNGHRLVAVHAHSAVVEYDASGKEVWRKDRLPAPPTSVERLENGSTLVACGNAQQVVEIAPDGSTTSLSVPGQPTWAQRLDSGNTLVALQQPIQRVVEVDFSGKIVWEARTGGNPPWHAVRMENGNTLVTLTQARKVVEFDPSGKSVVWSTQMSLIQPYAAQRLPGGNTLVADQLGLREIDPSGREIKWQQRLPQTMGLSSF